MKTIKLLLMAGLLAWPIAAQVPTQQTKDLMTVWTTDYDSALIPVPQAVVIQVTGLWVTACVSEPAAHPQKAVLTYRAAGKVATAVIDLFPGGSNGYNCGSNLFLGVKRTDTISLFIDHWRNRVRVCCGRGKRNDRLSGCT